MGMCVIGGALGSLALRSLGEVGDAVEGGGAYLLSLIYKMRFEGFYRAAHWKITVSMLFKWNFESSYLPLEITNWERLLLHESIELDIASEI